MKGGMVESLVSCLLGTRERVSSHAPTSAAACLMPPSLFLSRSSYSHSQQREVQHNNNSRFFFFQCKAGGKLQHLLLVAGWTGLDSTDQASSRI